MSIDLSLAPPVNAVGPRLTDTLGNVADDTLNLLNGAVLVLLVVFLAVVAVLTRDVARTLRRRAPEDPAGDDDGTAGSP